MGVMEDDTERLASFIPHRRTGVTGRCLGPGIRRKIFGVPLPASPQVSRVVEVEGEEGLYLVPPPSPGPPDSPVYGTKCSCHDLQHELALGKA